MLAKLTSKNQLTLPKRIVADFPGAQYFDVTQEDGRIVLTPVRVARADAVRAKLAALDLSETDVADAVAWARRAPLRAAARPAARPRRRRTHASKWGCRGA